MKSSVWSFLKFKGTQDKNPNKAKVYYSLCQTANKASAAEVSYSGGTTNLSSHLKNHQPAEYSKKETEKKKNKITSYMTTSQGTDGLRVTPLGNM